VLTTFFSTRITEEKKCNAPGATSPYAHGLYHFTKYRPKRNHIRYYKKKTAKLAHQNPAQYQESLQKERLQDPK
jgi:hypothetical protein